MHVTAWLCLGILRQIVLRACFTETKRNSLIAHPSRLGRFDLPGCLTAVLDILYYAQCWVGNLCIRMAIVQTFPARIAFLSLGGCSRCGGETCQKWWACR